MTDPLDELRALTAPDPAAPTALVAYLDKVHRRAYAVTDADLAALKEEGLTEDEIFEHTASVAIGEGLRRLDVAERAIG